MNDQVIRKLDEVIGLNPKDATAYLNRGDAYVEKGEYDKAIIDYNEAINLDPNSATAYNGRGIAYENICDYDQAITDYSQAIELDREYVRAYNNRGTVYHYRKQNFDKAIADYNQAIELVPARYAALYINRGYAYDNKGNCAKALEDYDNAVRLCPYGNDLVNGKFENWPFDQNDEYGQNEVDRIIERLSSIINDLPENNADHFYYTGVIALFWNDRLSAERAFQIALLKGYDDPDKINQHLANLK